MFYTKSMTVLNTPVESMPFSKTAIQTALNSLAASPQNLPISLPIRPQVLLLDIQRVHPLSWVAILRSLVRTGRAVMIGSDIPNPTAAQHAWNGPVSIAPLRPGVSYRAFYQCIPPPHLDTGQARHRARP